MGLLVVCAVLAQAKIIFEFKRGSFKPSPKVDLLLSKSKFRKRPLVRVDNEEIFL